jgi:hypothetical protein
MTQTKTTRTDDLDTHRTRMLNESPCPYTTSRGRSSDDRTDASALHGLAGIYEDELRRLLTFVQRPDRESREEAIHLIDTMRTVTYYAARAEREAVQVARSHGLSWADIGRMFGITRQAAQQRFGERD